MTGYEIFLLALGLVVGFVEGFIIKHVLTLTKDGDKVIIDRVEETEAVEEVTTCEADEEDFRSNPNWWKNPKLVERHKRQMYND